MHDDEIAIDGEVVRRLLASQFPRWASLPLKRVAPDGTVNAIFRLGDDMAVRLPRTPRHHDPEELPSWLATLAPQLPLTIPEPLGVGRPSDDYPWRWSIVRWVEGERLDVDRLDDPRRVAVQLAEFVAALHRIDVAALPASPPPAPELRDADTDVRAAAERARGVIDTDAFLKAWDAALQVPPWAGDAVLVHRDLGPGNLIVQHGRLAAVIDWGALSIGDPALDVGFGTLFSGEARAAFLSVLPGDDQMWQRIRGWQLTNVVSIPYYAETNPQMATAARQVIEEVLGER